MSNDERTYIMIKPDGVQRGLVGKIIERFETKGFKLVAMKLCSPGKAHMESHYADLAGKKFFPGLIEYMVSGPVVCMVRCQCTRSRGSDALSRSARHAFTLQLIVHSFARQPPPPP